MTAVSVENLVIHHGDVTAVADASFDAAEGEVTVILGPNGAGKTSTLECLEGFHRPYSGSVRVAGFDPVSEHSSLVRVMGAMLQGGGVYPSARPLELLRTTAAYYDDPLDPHALLDRVGLAQRQTASWRTLSGGEQQRLSLALALVGRPRIVFLDEPSAGVDVSGRLVIRELISGLREDGVTVLLSSHDLVEVEALADRIIIMDSGRIVADGPTEQILEAHTSEDFTFRASPGLDVAALTEALGCPVSEEKPGNYVVHHAPQPTLIARLASWLADRDVLLGDVTAGRKGLEDVFLKLTTEASAAEPSPPRERKR